MSNQSNIMFIRLLFIITFFATGRGYQLKQVIMLSRHHIRTPLTSNLGSLTPKQWPAWNGAPGDLTPKGIALEREFGKYFSDWMIENKLFENNCPGDQAFVYANTRLRTRESAKSFAGGAFGECVALYYKNTTDMDPVFNPVIRNTSAVFKRAVVNNMQMKLNSIDFNEEFNELNRIVEFEHSPFCRAKKICDLNEFKNNVVLEISEEPDISGAMRLANTLVDAFLMAYYDDMPPEDVAWGQIKTIEQWKKLLKIQQIYHELRFETKPLDRDVASTLIEYLSDIFQKGDRKFYLLVGHDANIHSLISSLNFKEFVLRHQIEKTPIGGKIVFQKWYDEKYDRDLLKVNYVYQTTKNLRDGDKVCLQNPPQWQILEMNNCPLDRDGFCPWIDFINFLKTVKM